MGELATREQVKPPAAIPVPELAGEIMEALVQGDISKLKPAERVQYYATVCERLGIDPAFKPFDYLQLNGKLTLYANKACAEQLRKTKSISIVVTGRETVGDVYVVTATATLPDGRTDESTGAVTVGRLSGDNLANALMKAETKAKRRVTLSICGLGMLDETELETVRGARVVDPVTGKSKPIGLQLPPRALSGQELKALYEQIRKSYPELPEDVRQWAAENIEGYAPPNNLTGKQALEMQGKLLEMAAIENAANHPIEVAPAAEAVPTESPETAAGTLPGIADVAATPMEEATKKHLFAALGELGIRIKAHRIKWAADLGVGVESFGKLSEQQARFLADKAVQQRDAQRSGA
jgi:hypothetical protein